MLSCLDGDLFLGTLNTLAYAPDINDGITVHQQTDLIIAVDVEDDGFVACGDEGGIKSCGEVLQVHAWGKHCVTAVAQHDWCGEVGCGSRCALHLRIIIIGGLYTFVTEWRLQFIKTTLKRLVTCQTTTANELCLGGELLDALHGCDGASGKAAVVSPHHH